MERNTVVAITVISILGVGNGVFSRTINRHWRQMFALVFGDKAVTTAYSAAADSLAKLRWADPVRCVESGARPEMFILECYKANLQETDSSSVPLPCAGDLSQDEQFHQRRARNTHPQFNFHF